MIYYLSGPMSGIPDDNRPAFKDAALKLRGQGFNIISPIESDENVPQGSAWSKYLKKDLRLLADSDGIIMLPGWENSKGARLEMYIMFQLGLPVNMYDGATAIHYMQRTNR